MYSILFNVIQYIISIPFCCTLFFMVAYEHLEIIWQMSLWLTFKYITLKICSQLFNTSYLSHFATFYFRKWTIRLPFISVSEVINYWNNQKRFSKLCSVISFNHIDEGYSIIAQNTVKKSSTRFFYLWPNLHEFLSEPYHLYTKWKVFMCKNIKNHKNE